ncbi:MAG: ferredoxin [Halobacteria archaeon]|nr:ferredoxin [Halobacteria archaeon]
MTEYEIELDRKNCDGIFACLVRDDVHLYEDVKGEKVGVKDAEIEDGVMRGEFDDDLIDDAVSAAEACPPDALRVVRDGETVAPEVEE